MSDWPFVRAVKRTKPSRKVPEGAFALTHWANWLPGVTSIPTVASPLAGTVTLLLEKETLTPLPFQSVELPVKRPPEMFSDKA